MFARLARARIGGGARGGGGGGGGGGGRLLGSRRGKGTAAWPAVQLTNTLTRARAPVKPRLTWYACGPTVYDDAHLGHARSYVAQDVLRRVLEAAGVVVHQVMGMTDIDDKVLQRAAENGVPWQQLARTYEERFLQDMDALGVLPPATITRVTDYVPEIVRFVASLERDGLAYPLDGSVYFDTTAFTRTPQHVYGRLQPARQQGADADDGQGPATRKSPRDFALWKAVRADPAEPWRTLASWPSPWGPGRPGWHIECSVMASHHFGPTLDLHSGGVDLQFPHHDNEMAQCEAFHHTPLWCGHFVHWGHLHIQGMKMSKSLKNFTTVRTLLERHPARLFRLFCLQHHYASNVDYNDDRMRDAAALDKRFAHFFTVAAEERQRAAILDRGMRNDSDRDLHHAINATAAGFWDALADDLDTPTALNEAAALAARISGLHSSGQPIPPLALARAAATLAHGLGTLGLDYAAAASVRTTADPARSTGDGRPTVDTVVSVLADFRARVASVARPLVVVADGPPPPPPPAVARAVLDECDHLRDRILPPLQIALQDAADGGARWRWAAAPANAADASDAAKDAQRAKAADLEARRQLAPSEFFRAQTELYSVWDAEGLPTHDAQGQPLSATQRKRLAKKLAKHAAAWHASGP